MRSLALVLACAACLSARTPLDESSAGRPALAISVNGSAEAQIAKGWPLIVRGLVSHSQRAVGKGDLHPLRLHPARASWAEAIRLRAVDDNGAESNWPLSLASPPDAAALELPAGTWVEVSWRMKPADTAQLAAGRYRVHAQLAIEEGVGWKGTESSPSVLVRVADTSDLPADDAAAAEAMLRAQDALLGGDRRLAAEVLDALLSRQPGRVKALAARAQLAQAAGDVVLASLFAARALALSRVQHPDAKEPPVELILLRDRLFGVP